MNLSTYLKNSSHRFYGAIVASVMLVLYEIFIKLGGSNVIIAPDVWLRTILNFSGISQNNISLLMLTLFILAIPVFYKSGVVLEARIMLLMIFESLIWGIITGILIKIVMSELFFMSGSISGSVIGDLGLAIGAGLFEELFFRVILTTALIWIGCKIIPLKWVALLTAVMIASFLFSLAHYVGNAADYFELYSFLFRFLAGLWFTTLYALRGFAVVGLTHAFYDIFVMLM